jgi:L-ascorbate metabolism protein UlaG (beta-lactamase superfamily)
VRRSAVAVLATVLAACGPLPTPEPGPYHRADATVSITRLVHDSVLVEVGGARFYVDPWLYSGVLFRQTEPLGLRPHALPPADAVLITARADERFDRRALRQIAPQAPIAVAPPALADDLRALGFREVRPLTPWQETRVGAVVVTAVPTGSRGSNGYVLSGPDARVYAAGPTRPFDGLADVATAFPDLDVALLPIGGQRILGFRREMGPEEAAAAAVVLRPRRIIPIGYGRTGGQPIYWYARHPAERFRDALAAAGMEGRTLVVLPPGESWHYYARP